MTKKVTRLSSHRGNARRNEEETGKSSIVSSSVVAVQRATNILACNGERWETVARWERGAAPDRRGATKLQRGPVARPLKTNCDKFDFNAPGGVTFSHLAGDSRLDVTRINVASIGTIVGMLLISANESEEVSNLRSPHVSQLEFETGSARS